MIKALADCLHDRTITDAEKGLMLRPLGRCGAEHDAVLDMIEDPYDLAREHNARPPGWTNPESAARYQLAIVGAGPDVWGAWLSLGIGCLQDAC